MTVPFNKFDCFLQDLAHKVHNLGSDTIKAALTNVAPVASNTVFTNITEISAGLDYTSGGKACSVVSCTQTGGVLKLKLSDPSTYFVSGTLGPFRYVYLYNNVPGTRPLIGWYDYGASISVLSGEAFQFSFDAVNGVFDIA